MTRLKLLRMKRGLKQQQMASILGLSQTFLSRLECGWFARCPNFPIVEGKLRKFFGQGESFKSLMQEVDPDVGPSHTDDTVGAMTAAAGAGL